MTDSQASHHAAPNISPRYPQTPGGRRSTGSTTSKLRYSCHACALSKVKCPKNKPRCSRCETRGIACEYFVSKRPGRKRDTRPPGLSSGSNDDGSRDTISVGGPDGSRIHAGSWHGGNTNVNNNTDANLSINIDTNNGSMSIASRSGGSGHLDPSVLIPSPPSQDNAMTGADYPSSVDLLSSLWIPFETSLPSAAGAMTVDFNDFFISPIDFPELEGLDATTNNNNLPTSQAHGDIAKLLIPDDTASNAEYGSETSSMGLLSLSVPSSPSSDGQGLSSTRGTSVPEVLETHDCGCLVKALLLMKSLSSSPTSTATNRSSPRSGTFSLLTNPSSPDDTAISLCQSTDNSGSSGRSRSKSSTSGIIGITGNIAAQSVVAENRTTIEAVSTVLRCPCASQDGYLVAILSLIVSKLLGRYAAAAAARGQAEARAAGGRPPADGVDHDSLVRMSAQLVLGELHRVQRLVNELSPRLKALRAGVQGVGGTAASSSVQVQGKGKGQGKSGSSVAGVRRSSGGDRRGSVGGGGMWEGEGMTAPFSAATLDQIEVDLRRRLGVLSSEIIDMLRR